MYSTIPTIPLPCTQKYLHIRLIPICSIIDVIWLCCCYMLQWLEWGESGHRKIWYNLYIIFSDVIEFDQLPPYLYVRHNKCGGFFESILPLPIPISARECPFSCITVEMFSMRGYMHETRDSSIIDRKIRELHNPEDLIGLLGSELLFWSEYTRNWNGYMRKIRYMKLMGMYKKR